MTSLKSQITQGNWLLGGSANFSTSSQETAVSTGVQKSSYLNYQIAPNIGYFFKDKFAGGLKAGITKGKADYGDLRQGGVTVASGGYSNATWFDLGPFARYYLLSPDRQFNLFAEGNFMYGLGGLHPGKSSRYNYSFYAGPVIYFNSSVGLEFTIGYSSELTKHFHPNTNELVFSSKIKALQVGLGFQFYLERDK
jgi:hypothetical protein